MGCWARRHVRRPDWRCTINAHFSCTARNVTYPDRNLLPKAHFGFNCSVLGLYPNDRVAGHACYRLVNWLILCNVSLVLLLLAYALHETDNTVDMGDDMVWIIGVGPEAWHYLAFT